MGRTLAQTQATRQAAPLRALSVALFVVFHHDEAMLTRSLTAAIVAAQEGQRHSRITSRFTVIHNGNATDDVMRAVIRLARRSARDTVTVPISVMRQSHRHPLSGGHLSRDWNTALLFAFGSLAAPECDFAVLMQHDCLLRPFFFSRAAALHLSAEPPLHFIAYGRGDELHSYTPGAVQAVGMWDERFSALGFAEADYFLRAARDLGPRASISDTMHGREECRIFAQNEAEPTGTDHCMCADDQSQFTSCALPWPLRLCSFFSFTAMQGSGSPSAAPSSIATF